MSLWNISVLHYYSRIAWKQRGSDVSTAINELSPLINKRNTLLREIVRNRSLYLFILPGILYFLIIRYFPVYFIQVAFRDYKITRPISAANWVGFKYFLQLFESPDFFLSIRNTLIINLYQVLFGFPAPIILAIMLNEMKGLRFKKIIQTLVYLPHFISWVVIGGILKSFLSVQGGLINEFFSVFLAEPIPFLIDPRYFRTILVSSAIWKEVGWGTIIYLAAMAGIAPELYESATIDGANRFQKIIHITIPSIMYVIVVLLIIRLGNLLNMGFEQILVLYNPLLKDQGLVLQYFVWFRGLVNYRYSFAAAAGVFNSIIAFIMVFLADRAAKKIGQQGVF